MAELLVIAFLGGMVGTITGITPAFILYGFAGIVLTIMGVTDGFYHAYIVNLALMPCVCLAGSVAGTALAGRKGRYRICGADTMKSLSHINDWSVYLIGGFFGVLGFCMCSLFNYLKLPADTGAVSLILSSVLIRLCVSGSGLVTYEKIDRESWQRYIKRNLTTLTVLPILLSVTAFWVVKETGNIMICFYISAFSLILLKFDSEFPATHHITLISAYAASVFGNIWITLLFGLVSQAVFIIAGLIANYGKLEEGEAGQELPGQTSHIDPPTVSIALISAVVFACSII